MNPPPAFRDHLPDDRAPRHAETVRRPRAWRFLLSFSVLLGAYYAVAATSWFDRMLEGYLKVNASMAGAALRACGVAVEVRDTTIRSPKVAIAVRRGCDAIEPAWMLAAAVLAFPATWRSRGRVLLLGVVALLALNIVRIVTLFFIREWAPSLFAPAHLEVWPTIFILCALGMWVMWVRSLAGAASAREPVAA